MINATVFIKYTYFLSRDIEQSPSVPKQIVYL